AGDGSFTSVQMAPSATRKMPFITPSKCAARPMRTLVKCCSARPVSSPSRNRSMPSHISCRFLVFILIPPLPPPPSKPMLLHRCAGPLAWAELGPTRGPLYPIPIAQHEAGPVGRKLWSRMCASPSAQTDQFYESYVRFVDPVNEPALDGGPREDAHESALSSDL